MEIPTLVVSDPPHGEVDLGAAAEVLGLDIFVTRIKANFAAPEVMLASDPGKAAVFAAALRDTGFTVSIVHGAELTGLPWPDPVSFLSIDSSFLRASVRNESLEIANETLEIASDAEVVGVYCRPPADFSKRQVDLTEAVASAHGPTIAEAIQWMANLDLYFHDEGALRRISVVPGLLELDAEHLLTQLGRRFEGLRLDARLVDVYPRGRFVTGGADSHGKQRKGYSFGPPALHHVLESISPELLGIPQYELGSRLAYALSPLGSPS